LFIFYNFFFAILSEFTSLIPCSPEPAPEGSCLSVPSEGAFRSGDIMIAYILPGGFSDLGKTEMQPMNYLHTSEGIRTN
jgi:hypothetical protein